MNKDTALLLAALGVAAQVPTTIEKIVDPTVKALVQLLALCVLLLAAVKIDLKKTPSIPPPRMRDHEPDTLPDRKP